MTYLAIKLFIVNTLGYLQAHWRTVAILAAILLIALASILLTRSCGQRAVKLDEKELQQVNEAIETKERKKMEEVFVAVEVKQQEIDANVSGSKAQTVNAIADAKKKVEAMTDEELANYLESIK